MTNRTIRKIGDYGDYIKLSFNRKVETKLDYWLDQFDVNDYFIYKGSNKFREVSIEDLLEFKYASYIFFRKDKYDREVINSWIDFIYSFGCNSSWKYLDKPFPPEYVKEKIRIIK